MDKANTMKTISNGVKVSIIIPAHNEEAHIAQTLRALLRQTHRDIEIIVVDNASTDRTADIVRMFPVKLVYEPRKGTHYARERGRRDAQGEIIVNLDADCLPDPEWLTKGVRYFEDVRIVGVTGPCDYHDAPAFFRKLSLFTQRHIYRYISTILQSLSIKRGAVMFGGNAFFRRDVLQKIGGYDTSFAFYGDDTDTAKRIVKFGKIAFKNDVVLKTSARRFRHQGFLKTIILYFYHFFRVVLKQPAVSKKK